MIALLFATRWFLSAIVVLAFSMHTAAEEVSWSVPQDGYISLAQRP
jgi:hypothetical protein